MAKAPQTLRLTGEYATDSKAIAEALSAVSSGLSGRLTVSENILGRFVNFTFTAPVTEAPRVAYKTANGEAPQCVMTAGLWRTKPTYEAVGVAMSVMWTYENGSIVLPWLTGMAGNDTYLLRLLVLES